MLYTLHTHSRAIEICSDGPGTHIYLSNRATASCRVNDFAGAIADLQRALTMAPQHGKQH
jgi:Flp pilus assembly protein TadD